LPERVILKVGPAGSFFSSATNGVVTRGLSFSATAGSVTVTGLFPDAPSGLAISIGVGVGDGDGKITGNRVCSFGSNFCASSTDGNSIATTLCGKPVLVGKAAKSIGDVANASELAFRNLSKDLSSFEGFESFWIGSRNSTTPGDRISP